MRLRLREARRFYGLFLDDGVPPGAREFNAGETAGSAMAFFQTVPILGLDGHSCCRCSSNTSPSRPPSPKRRLALSTASATRRSPPTSATNSSTGPRWRRPTSPPSPPCSSQQTRRDGERSPRRAARQRRFGTPRWKEKPPRGGRLDISAALKALVPVGEETVPPESALLSQPPAVTTSTSVGCLVRWKAGGGAGRHRRRLAQQRGLRRDRLLADRDQRFQRGADVEPSHPWWFFLPAKRPNRRCRAARRGLRSPSRRASSRRAGRRRR